MTKTERIEIRITEDKKEEFTEFAHERGWTVVDLIMISVENYIKRRKKKETK